MRLLDEVVSKINRDIENAISNVETRGIVNTISINGVMTNFDENGKRVMFDDKCDTYVYHKSDQSSYSELQAKGKTKTYQVTSVVDMFVMSKKRNTEDIINTILSKYKNIVITNLNTDAAAIFAKEAESDKFNPAYYVFNLTYQVKYKTSDCLKDVCYEC